MAVPPRPSQPRALLIEPQSLVAPYFAATLAKAGYSVVEMRGLVDARVREIDPTVVVVDATHLSEPLSIVRAIRREAPRSRIVVYARRLDSMWGELATSVGADVVIGPRSEENDFLAAVGRTTAA